MKNNTTKYEVKYLPKFSRQLKKVIKQGKDLDKLERIIIELANGKRLDKKYRDHKLIDDHYYKNCRECHIEPDWLLIYKYHDNELILFMVSTGSHSELFNK